MLSGTTIFTMPFMSSSQGRKRGITRISDGFTISSWPFARVSSMMAGIQNFVGGAMETPPVRFRLTDLSFFHRTMIKSAIE